ncbi:Fpg/Nei family DNA glycosylase [Novipirellula artificiosorum]|uniref:DNA-(apurinic or apyrimidinic site) lyase n=1 Tax=Novipirellula artificiosorum TaxID=2528016 RepID=A0A5C6D8Z4_9BACT|nr:DNA glycosylase [Novipirellula artificiosorum]TWU31329.1 Endonuclease 8 1 [Novipirellula artificiosorum]
MPEGHIIHRIARDHQRWFAGQKLRVSSPQGRFSEEASKLSGKELCQVSAHGKHLFYHWTRGVTTHVHLGLYGKFRVHQNPAPEPRGEVRVRMVGRTRSFDLNGPNCCELIDQKHYESLRTRLGEDPLRPDACAIKVWDRFTRSRAAIGSLLLNQSVIAGIGNVYRAELLFLIGIHPELPANQLNRCKFDELWETITKLLKIGVKHNRIIAAGLDKNDRPRSRSTPSERLNVYKRDKCPECDCRIISWPLGGRKIYACCQCQKK